MREKKKKKIIILSLIGLLCIMTAGYAAFQTNLKIKGTSKVNSNWDVRITSVTQANKTGSAEEAKAPTWDNLTAYMEADLYEKGDSIEYDVTVENNGTLDASLENIEEKLNSENEAIKITFSGYTKGEKLYKNSSQTIKVKIEYNPDFEGTPEESSREVSVDLNYVQAEGGTIVPTDKYLVTYDCTANGGNACTSYNEYLNEGDFINLTYTSTKEGYEFIGWNTDKDATTELTELQMPEEEITLYAIYRKQLNITYIKGENITSIGKESDSCYLYNKQTTCEITLPQITPDDSYTAMGWYKDEEKVGDADQKYTISNNVTLNSKAKLTSYTLTYNYNGATGGNTETGKTVEYQKPYGDLPTPTKSYTVTYNYNGATAGNTSASATSNYTFNGWYKESTLTTKINSTDNYILTSNSTIYASWTSKAVTLPTPTKTGYTFGGWYSDSGLTTKVGDAGASYTPSKTITLYAKWVDNIKPTVSLNPNTQTTYVKSKAVTVTLADAGSGLKASQKIYYAWSTSSTTAPTYSSYVTTTNTAGAKSTTVTVPATSNSSLTGTYYLWIKVGTLADVAGNTSAVKTSAAFKFDNTKPTVSLNPNTQTSYVKSKAVTVTLADSHSGLPASQKIYYAWSTSNTTAPSYSSYVTTTNTAGATSTTVTVPATSNSSLTGTYYLWIKVGTLADTVGNTSLVKTSAAFKFDNTAPTCTASGGTNAWIALSQTIKGTCSDSHSGCTESQVTKTYSIASGTTGNYNASYSPGTVKDNAGNTTACPTAKVKVTGNTLQDYQSGAVFMYDGKTGLSSSTWTDQSGNGRHGTLVNATKSGNSVYFNGTNAYVRIAQLNYTSVTMEAYFNPSSLPDSTESMLMSNAETGGYSLAIWGKKIVAHAYKSGWQGVMSSDMTTGTKYYGAARFNASNDRITLNNTTTTITRAGTITAPGYSTYLVLGSNPYQNAGDNGYYKGYIYNARMYSSVLTDDQLQKHYVIDKSRAG